jgi:hypothetical protein
MAHLVPSWPDQVLCKENKRKALAEQQRRWMQQREQEMSRQTADDHDDDLDKINGFLDDIGRTLTGRTLTGPRKIETNVVSSYDETNAMLRDIHLTNSQKRGASHDAEPAARVEAVTAVVSLVRELAPPVRSQRRTATQRAAAERLTQLRPTLYAAVPPPPPLLGSEAFYKHQQEGIRNFRTAYDARVQVHSDALAAGSGWANVAPPASADAIGALAHEIASRHVAPISHQPSAISQVVHASRAEAGGTLAGTLRRPRPEPSTSMVGFTSGKTAGRRGGRVGRSGSIHAALRAAEARGPLLSERDPRVAAPAGDSWHD